MISILSFKSLSRAPCALFIWRYLSEILLVEPKPTSLNLAITRSMCICTYVADTRYRMNFVYDHVLR